MSTHNYYPFGQEATSETQDAEAMKFTGHERDTEFNGTGGTLDYMHARYYGVHVGRFVTVDPGRFLWRAPQSANRYSYTSNNPLRNFDPDGRETNPVTGASNILDAQILNSATNPRKGHFGLVRRAADGTPKKHGGTDITAPKGTPLFSPVSGTVVQSGDGGKEGGFVLRIRRTQDENGQPVYIHISHLNRSPNVRFGDTVTEGQANVAEVGNTGNARNEPPHAHVSVMVGGETRDHQVDPQEWFADHPSTLQPKETEPPCQMDDPC